MEQLGSCADPATASRPHCGRLADFTMFQWRPSGPSRVRDVFRDACQKADIPFINPHAVRSALMQLGLELCATWEELKAWSQNLGHEKLDTSMVHYGKLGANRQNELMQGLERTDLTVREEQELLTNYRRLSAKKRASVLDIQSPN